MKRRHWDSINIFLSYMVHIDLDIAIISAAEYNLGTHIQHIYATYRFERWQTCLCLKFRHTYSLNISFAYHESCKCTCDKAGCFVQNCKTFIQQLWALHIHWTTWNMEASRTIIDTALHHVHVKWFDTCMVNKNNSHAVTWNNLTRDWMKWFA